MSRPKPQNPYVVLRDLARGVVRQVRYPWRKTMWTYRKDRLNEGWDLSPLAERVQAADALGFDVRLEWTDSGLAVVYVKRVDIPWQLA